MKTAIVTGANSGMGKVTAQYLMQNNFEVILVCRNQQKGDETIMRFKQLNPDAKLHLYIADLSSVLAVNNLANQIVQGFSKIDLLVNNAGSYIADRKESIDGYELTLATNHLSYFQLTILLMPLLKAATTARIVNVASDAHKMGKFNIGDINLTKSFSGILAYGNSKMYNIMFSVSLAQKLKDTNITVNAMHPGGVATNFWYGMKGIVGMFFQFASKFMRTPEKGAETIIWLSTSAEVEGVTGKYFKDKKEIIAVKEVYKPNNLDNLWNESERLITKALAK